MPVLRHTSTLTLLLVLSCAAAAQTSSAPPPDQLLYNTLRTLQSAPHLSVDIHREIRNLAAGPIANPDHQADANTLFTVTQSIAFQRPNRLRLNQTWDKPAGIQRTVDLLDHTTLLFASQRDPARPWTGHTGDFPENSLDALFRSDDTAIAVQAVEVSRLFDSQAYERFFQYATHLEFLGAATDNSIPVWRLRFQDLDGPPRTWELWITQEDPPRITRLHTSRTNNISISDNEKNSTFSSYPLTEQIECVFSNWNFDDPLPADAFTPPAGHFQRTTYRKVLFHVGDTLPLPTLTDTTGNRIDLTHPAALSLLEFWRTETDWHPPELQALVNAYAPQRLRLYLIDSYNSAEQIRDHFAKDHRPQPSILLDPDQTYEKSVGNYAWPTLLLLSPDGKLLARENPSPLGLARLKTALTAATTPPTK